LQPRRHPRPVARPSRDLIEQPGEPHHAGAEDSAAVGQLALGVLHRLERRHHQDRLLVEPRPVGVEQHAGLAGVGGSRDKLQRHGDRL
jgi:hypothetical protein